MADRIHAPPSPLPDVAVLGTDDIRAALAAGWADFRRAPAFGILFGAVYALGGLTLYLALTALGHVWWLVPLAAGFPILAPFAAVGLYEVSRRLERGERLQMGAVLGVVLAEKDRQIPSMAVVILLFFMFWVFVAHTVFALFFGLAAFRGSVGAMLFTAEGAQMLAVGSVIGGAMALALFALTVISLPLLLDKEVDFITAMLTSMQAVQRSPWVMLTWALTIAVLVFAAMLPWFLGLLVVLPVLGHASWHLYRRVLPQDAPQG